MRTPDYGHHHPQRPGHGVDAKEVAFRATHGANLGSRMWFHEDMVHALTHGAARDGWSGGIDARGPYIRWGGVGVGAGYVWRITDNETDCDAIPGTKLIEGIWA